MEVKARDLTAGDTIKVGGNKHTVTGIGQRGGHTDLFLTSHSGREYKMTCDSGTRLNRVDQ